MGTQTLTTADGSPWTSLPAGATNLIIECFGAGGGGGPSDSTKSGNAGGGGGGGAYSKLTIASPSGGTGTDGYIVLTWTEASAVSVQILVSGVWKTGVPQIMVGGAWKEITSIQIMVDGAWKGT